LADLSKSRWKGLHGLPKYTAFISGMEKFDADFFGYLVKSAKPDSMDAQSRMILEHAYEAILDAGV
jgi:fatty acid synthase